MSAAEPREEALALRCADERTWGILTRPPAGTPQSPLAVLIAVGGPQYRVGSHRQFVQLARGLAQHGVSSLRFDYRGMGDSEGQLRNFEHVAKDLRAGIDTLARACSPARGIVVWGLCDAASAAMMYATADSRVVGLVAANPWARSAASLGAARVKHYYLARLVQREFWSKVFRGGFEWRRSIGALLDNLQQTRRYLIRGAGDRSSFQSRMAHGLANFRGRVLLIISTHDITAMEFLQYAGSAPEWRGMLGQSRVSRCDIDGADHTFSRRLWSEQVQAVTVDWLKSIVVPLAPQAQTRP